MGKNRTEEIRGGAEYRCAPAWNAGLVALMGALALLAGCCSKPQPQAYWGPTLGVQEVVQTINANNQRIPSVWCYLKEFSVEVLDEHEASHIYSGNDGNLIFQRPRNLYLVCNMLSVEAFEIGTTQQVYWLKVPPADKMWKGTYARIAGVDLRQLPIAPEMILDVLGVGTIDDNLLRWPLPVMRFDNYRDAYALLWSFPLEDHWAALKEVWYDRKSLLPVEVRLYDARGRMAVQALLSDPQPLAATQEDAAGAADAPRMATNYDLLFPETQTRLHLRLAHPSLRNGNIPNAKTFQVLQQTHLDNPEVKDVYDLDRGPATQP